MTTCCTEAGRQFAFSSPDEAIEAMLARIGTVGVETVPLHSAAGRILAEAVVADRPSPACDVSAMDGYAVRLADLAAGRIAVAGDVRIGCEPPALLPGEALRIVTGAPLPAGAEAVVRREDVDEQTDHFNISPAAVETIRSGANIRRCGENALAGAEILRPGRVLGAAAIGALAAFGCASPRVYRRVRIAIVTTGDEVLPPGALPTPWQLRDSNGPALSALIATAPWLELAVTSHASDQPDELMQHIRRATEDCDAILLTGGVSMGNRDFVPAIVRELGAQTIFHKLPQRPGKPLLGAVSDRGQPIFGLPGNPLSVMVTARRIAMPVLIRAAGGSADALAPCPVTVEDAPGGRIPTGFWWHRPARLIAPGQARIVALKGSGDVAGAAQSDGFVEFPPQGITAAGPMYFAWSLR